MAGERSYSSSLIPGATQALKHVTTNPQRASPSRAPGLREEVKFLTFCFFFSSLWEINTCKRGKKKARTYPQSSLTVHYGLQDPNYLESPLISGSPNSLYSKHHPE